MFLLALSVLPLMAKTVQKNENSIPVVLDTPKNVTRRPFPEALCHLPETEVLRNKATSLPACLYKADIFLNPFLLFSFCDKNEQNERSGGKACETAVQIASAITSLNGAGMDALWCFFSCK